MTINNISSFNEDHVTQLSHYGPVTCIKLYEDYILVGYGPILHIYRVHPTGTNEIRRIFSKQLFKRNKIHSIFVNSILRKCIVSGAKSFMVFDLDLLDVMGKEMGIHEWIICSTILNDNTVLLLNAYNMIYQVNIFKKDEELVALQKIHCGEKSILYSGSIDVLSNGKIYIAAGTVMNGVLVWDLHTQRIVHKLNDHEGSIFGVKISPDGKYIISCSDDRSIKLYDMHTAHLMATGWGHGSRIWNLEFGKHEVQLGQEPKDKNRQGSSAETSIDEEYEHEIEYDLEQQQQKEHMEETLEGIDGVVVKSSKPKHSVKIMSIGEDCTLRTWEYDSTDQLKQLKIVENCHRGKHVWSGDIDDVYLNICCTGGADGRVRVHDLTEKNQVTTKLTIDDFSLSTDGIEFKSNDFIRDYVELTKLRILVCLTLNGHVFVYHYETRKCEHLAYYEALNGFGIVHAFNEANTVLIASRAGNILCITFSENTRVPVAQQKWLASPMEMKITNMLCFAKNNGSFHVLLESPNPKIPFLLKEFIYENGNFEIVGLKEIPKSLFNSPLTAMAIDAFNQCIILASKRMTIAVVDLTETSNSLNLKKIAQGDSVSSVSIVNSKKGFFDVLVLARDGTYLLARVTRSEKLLHLELQSEVQQEFADLNLKILHENKLTRGFIEGGYFDDNNKDLILYGFKSSYFYVWNETKQIEIMSQYCGGNGHRHFKFLKQSDTNFSFVYLFKSDVYVCHFQGRFFNQNYGLIHNGVHGREIRDLNILRQTFSDGTRLLVTSAEDSTIALSKMTPSTGNVEGVWSMNNHISGMQKVKFLNENYVLSSAANEEFFIWELNWFDDVPLLKEMARLKSDKAVLDLRVMDFDAEEHNTYIFAVTVFSNSKIKLWKICKETNAFEMISEWNYSSCCILNCQLFTLNNSKYLIIATTDGCLTIWNIDDPKAPQLEVTKRLHQSGVKAICLINHDNYVHVVTGGDDNALGLSKIHTLVESTGNSNLQIELISFEPSASSATITSIAQVDKLKVVVASVDQIVRVWSIGESLNCILAKFTTVADTGCCDVIDDLLVVGGAGISVNKLNL
ncbi:conserved hypothetical protein [Lodderomyces elongisporus NRRL YB-4239]|uniref:Uncharacterized protein n=1 Tax=Lodderomyces elongisporus (strain ATCC 11503 / CBS 2605 / JCM 1781 / NBRC 1676 / NRRL YB-4239) TaxID=379508 RepID=A5E5E7_LODEL|nr:conserved hypothetical protein [Lodderomyces elongisporus NRRL YB-4239]